MSAADRDRRPARRAGAERGRERDRHPARRVVGDPASGSLPRKRGQRSGGRAALEAQPVRFGASPRVDIPSDRDQVVLELDGRAVRVTNLRKVFWPALGLTKGDRGGAYLGGVML